MEAQTQRIAPGQSHELAQPHSVPDQQQAAHPDSLHQRDPAIDASRGDWHIASRHERHELRGWHKSEEGHHGDGLPSGQPPRSRPARTATAFRPCAMAGSRVKDHAVSQAAPWQFPALLDRRAQVSGPEVCDDRGCHLHEPVPDCLRLLHPRGG